MTASSLSPRGPASHAQGPSPVAAVPAIPAEPPRPSARARDDDERALNLLTGPEAGDILAAALRPDGAELVSWHLDAVHHRPGAGVTVGFDVAHRAPTGAEGRDYLCLSTARLTSDARRQGGYLTLDDGDAKVVAWRHPHDPELPALAAACVPVGASVVLRAADVEVGEDLALELVAYRPTRRAVVRLRAAGVTWYLKVLRPRHLVDVHARHVQLREAGVPVPPVRLADATGMLLLEELPGEPLAEHLAADGARSLDPARLVGVLDSLPASLLDLDPRPAWADRAAFYGHGAAAVLPDRADEIGRLVRRIEHALAVSDPGPLVPTHGDFYEAQLLLGAGGRTVSGVLDVDTAGPGRRVDDLACALGHLAVLPSLAPDVYPHVPSALGRWYRAFATGVDRRALQARVAGVVLSLVAGGAPDGLAATRLGIASAWADASERPEGPIPGA